MLFNPQPPILIRTPLLPFNPPYHFGSMESVQADARLEPVGTDERHSCEYPEDGTDGVEDSRVLKAETNVYRVMTFAAICGGVVVREEVTMVCSSLGVVVGVGEGGGR